MAWSQSAPAVTVITDINWLFFRSFIFSTPYPSCPLVTYHIELMALLCTVCAHLRWVDCVTRHKYDELTGDMLTVWQLDCVTSWLVAEWILVFHPLVSPAMGHWVTWCPSIFKYLFFQFTLQVHKVWQWLCGYPNIL